MHIIPFGAISAMRPLSPRANNGRAVGCCKRGRTPQLYRAEQKYFCFFGENIKVEVCTTLYTNKTCICGCEKSSALLLGEFGIKAAILQ